MRKSMPHTKTSTKADFLKGVKQHSLLALHKMFNPVISQHLRESGTCLMLCLRTCRTLVLMQFVYKSSRRILPCLQSLISVHNYMKVCSNDLFSSWLVYTEQSKCAVESDAIVLGVACEKCCSCCVQQNKVLNFPQNMNEVFQLKYFQTCAIKQNRRSDFYTLRQFLVTM